MIGIHTAPHDPKIERLREVPLFAGCSHEQLTAIARLVDEVDVPAHRHVIREGRLPYEFLVLVEGEAEVVQAGRLLRRLGPGDFVGELSILAGGARTASVVTTTPARLLVLTDRAFARIVESVPGLSAKLLRELARRAAATRTDPLAAA